MINFNVKLILILSSLFVVLGIATKYIYSQKQDLQKELEEQKLSFNIAVREYENQLKIKDEELSFIKNMTLKKDEVQNKSKKTQIEKAKRGEVKSDEYSSFTLVYF